MGGNTENKSSREVVISCTTRPEMAQRKGDLEIIGLNPVTLGRVSQSRASGLECVSRNTSSSTYQVCDLSLVTILCLTFLIFLKWG